MRILAVLTLCFPLAEAVASECGAPPFDRATLERDAKTELAGYDAARRQALALALVPCLASPDPGVRDDLAYTILDWQMRKDQLEPDTLRAIEADLRDRLTAPDPEGFARPFAALALASVATVDARAPFLDDAGRERLLEAATAYVRGIDDYRGWDEREGWRHGVAHGADLLAALGANPAFGPEAHGAILAAVARQVAPRGHAYAHGEPERLATAVVAVTKHGLVGESAWEAWLGGIASPAPFESWDAVESSQDGIAKRKDTVAFLTALELKLREAGDPAARLADAVAKHRTM